MNTNFAPEIATELDVHQFSPGEKLRGHARWSDPGSVGSAELRLFHYTEGKGTQEVEVVQTLRQDAPGPFEFQLPQGPYSFSGRLISLAWALELIITPGSQVARLDFVLSPTAQEIDLTRHELPEVVKTLSKRIKGFARKR